MTATWFSPGVKYTYLPKVILTTAYPENHSFSNYFDLLKDEIEKRTFTIPDTLPICGNEIQGQYLSKGDELREYHTSAIKKAREILKANEHARILLFMDTTHSNRNIARQVNLEILDLETESDRSKTAAREYGRLILATPSFASRIPIEGMTDVICPPTQTLPVVDEYIHREVFKPCYLAKWELALAKNHLDRTCDNPTIHYMFQRSDCSLTAYGARWFHYGDFIDILLGLIRLCPEHAMHNSTPMRFGIPLARGQRAFTQLMAYLETVIRGPARRQELVPYYLLTSAHRIWPMPKLWDCCGLDRRQAFFLGQLENLNIRWKVKATNQRFVNMVAVAMVVFGENPILRWPSPPQRGQSMVGVFETFQDIFHLGLYHDFTSDAWINAVVWISRDEPPPQNATSPHSYERTTSPRR
ncbi:hypothetical protein GGR58DRAFT_490186 [Xylaria digitata]|nr:hypothetical protein GGR58DRAFT_490186 [Xylaria digitata]